MAILYIIVLVVGYFLGAIPFGYLLVRVFRGEDIRRSGSGNIGATNVVRSGAKGLGLTTLLLDALKGTFAVWIALGLADSGYNTCGGATPCIPAVRLMAAAALAAVLGHMFPVWLKFRGGKGVATAVGVFAMLVPKALVIAFILFVIVVALTRYVSLGSILAAIAVPVAAWFVEPAGWRSLVMIAIICTLVIIKHHQNISRLLAGSENRLGAKKAATPEKPA